MDCSNIDYCARLERIPYQDFVINGLVLWAILKYGKCPDKSTKDYHFETKVV